MKKYLIYILTSAVILAAGCAQEPAEKGFGHLRFKCSADEVIGIKPLSRGQIRTSELPDADALALNIMGSDGYNRDWETIAAFNTENPLIREGDYTATVTYGDIDEEGRGKPCLFGEQAFTLVARQTSEVKITAQLANAQVLVQATPQFLYYFNTIHFTLTTGSGNEFAFDLDAKDYVATPVYVKPGTTLTLAGTARRQSQNGTAQGVLTPFDEQTVTATEARKRYLFTFDAASAGSAQLTIQIGEDYEETLDFTFELNDDATLTPIE